MKCKGLLKNHDGTTRAITAPNPPGTLPSGYKLFWLGRMRVTKGTVYWNNTPVGKIKKLGQFWMSVKIKDDFPTCPTCGHPAHTPLPSGTGFRCENPENEFKDGLWTHQPVWNNTVKLHHKRDNAIFDILPRG